jgi:hypothetical protein
MTSIAWKLNRLRSMSPTEMLLRGQRALVGTLESTGLARPTVPDPAELAVPLRLLISEFSPQSALVRNVVDRADAILSGRWRIFAREFSLGFPPCWDQDPKTGRQAPLRFGKSIDYRDAAIVGDIKYLWEINRHLELTTLAQAFHLTKHLRYSAASRMLLSNWFESCPYPFGPNWCSGLELAIRLVNWALAWELLDVDRSPEFATEGGAALKRRWIDAVFLHCDFIAKSLSLHSSANNHLLGEYTGLLIASLRWPLWSRSSQWHSLAKSGVESEALRQNGPDGVSREQAIHYQHEVADMMLLSLLACRSRGIDLSAAYWARLEAMLEFIASVMDYSGHVPMIGDSDDGVIARFDAADANVYRSLLASGAVLFARSDFRSRAKRFDDKSRWLLGDVGADTFHALSANELGTPRTDFPDGGYYILGAHFNQRDEVRIVADAGPVGYLSIAAHGHADALSLVANVGGHEILVDSGTFSYHTAPEWRAYFRGTRAHNTVCVDGIDQSQAGGNFLWLRKANVDVIHRSRTAQQDRLVARHDGYMRLDDPVRHTRTITFCKDTGHLYVEDDIECAAMHQVDLHWHFSEICDVYASSGGWVARVDNVAVEIALEGPVGDVSVVRGELDPPLGWISRRLDQKTPTSTLRYSAHVDGTCRFRSSFRFFIENPA